jgi:hypothetical protein
VDGKVHKYQKKHNERYRKRISRGLNFLKNLALRKR